MALNVFAMPQKVDPEHVCGVAASLGPWPAKVHLDRPNAHLEKRHQDLIIEYNALLQAVASKHAQLLPRAGVAPVGLQKTSSRQRSNSLSSCDSSTKASSPKRSHSVYVSSSDDDCHDERTTITLRNIPAALTRATLVQLLDKRGLKGIYNMVYLPMDRLRKRSKGFAFVNFHNSKGARRCMSIFQGFQDWVTLSKKVCAVEWAEQQGDLQSQMQAYGNLFVRADVPEEFKPALFRNGVQVLYSASFFE